MHVTIRLGQFFSSVFPDFERIVDSNRFSSKKGVALRATSFFNPGVIVTSSERTD